MQLQKQPTNPRSQRSNPRQAPIAAKDARQTHVYGKVKGKEIVCSTDTRGFPTPNDADPLELVVNAPGGVIPLWDKNVTLRYRFDEESLRVYFADPDAAKNEITLLFAEAVSAWGDAAPVKFSLNEESSDFQIVMMPQSNCNLVGCVLASAFFPDSGRHHLRLYPTLFQQTREEQVETLIHEIGHIFGLRHFFAQLRETSVPSKIFGEHNEVSIMNYGPNSRLTETDKSDLKKLYQLAWSGELTEIDRARIVFVQPFSTIASATATQSRDLAARVTEPGRRFIQTPIQISISGHKVTIE